MKLLQLTEIPSPFMEQLVRRCEQHVPGLDIVPVFVGDPGHRPTWGNLTWPGFQLRGGKLARFSQLKEIISQVKPDRFLLHSYNRLESWWLRRHAVAQNQKFFVGALEPLAPRSGLTMMGKLALMSRFLKCCSGLATMGKRAHYEYGKIYQGAIVDCPYCFDMSEMLSFDDSQRDPNKVTFLYSGRLASFRDPLLALEAFAEVQRQYGDRVGLIISGKGQLQEQLETRISDLQLGQSVRWMNDFENWEDLRNLYRHADVLLSVGRFNTWNLTIQEAMAARMPVIATYTTEAANTLVIDEHNGFLVHHGDKQAIVNRMGRYVEDRGLLASHGQRNREVARTVDVGAVASRLGAMLTS